MSTPNEFQTLVTVTTEIDLSEVRFTYANQCIKAQEDLSNRLKAEIERKKEVCNFQKNNNLIIHAEIQNAEHEIRNLIITQNAITSANTETKRELLLAKENNIRLVERMTNTEKKYENLWIESKKRYESIPIVKKLMQTTKKFEALQVDIKVLANEIKVLNADIKIKKEELINKDRTQIIQLAQFIVHEMPAAMQSIKEKSMEVEVVTKEIDSIMKEQEANHNKILSGTIASLNLQQSEDNNKIENWAKINNNNNDTLMMPRLQLQSFELDITSVKLDINKVGIQIAPVKRTMSVNEMERNSIKRGKDDNLNDNYISCYFNKTTENVDEKENNKSEDFSRKKLINILEDVKLDEKETYKILSKISPDKFQDIDVITADNPRNNSPPNQFKTVTPLESEEIKEIDLTNTNNDANVLVQPAQFLDLFQDNGPGGYQQKVEAIVHTSMEDPSSKTENRSIMLESVTKKRVSFDIPMSVEEITNEIENEVASDDNKGNKTNDTIGSQLDLSIGVDDNFSLIKDVILKKHKLDLSPQFIYGKNMMLQKKSNDKIVTSKFFESNTKNVETDEVITEHKGEEVNKVDSKEPNPNEKPQGQTCDSAPEEENLENMEVDNDIARLKADVAEKPVSGLLFTHGPRGIPECLDISMSTTGYEEGDSDFPTGLDSSLLLSPKGDVSANNDEIGSQEVPNFLSGFRKAGLSFFGPSAPSENNPDGSKQNQENKFSFNFCPGEKKNRGIFSFFR